MQENHLFEYAVIRMVPHVEREEFINVGVILLCARQKFLKALFMVDEPLLNALCKHLDISEIKNYIDSFDRICQGTADSGPIGKLPVADRFRWLTAARSTVLQTSRVHPGLCTDPAEMLTHLYNNLVLRDK